MIMNRLSSMRLFILAICSLCIGSNITAQHKLKSDAINILFIGSSYLNYNDLPRMFDSLVMESPYTVVIDRFTVNGQLLHDFARRPDVEVKINEKDWDYVVLSGTGSRVAYPEVFTDFPVFESLDTLKRKILRNCDSTKIINIMPWAFEDGMLWVQGWTDDYFDMQAAIYDNSILYADSLGLIIAPVGWAWHSVLKEKRRYTHYLHLDDWNHPNTKGTYLMACVIYSTIFKKSCMPNAYYSTLSIDDALYFQTKASKTVLDSINLWNIDSVPVVQPPTGISSAEHLLYQNYPNPFKYSTQISYNLTKASHVELKVMSVMGNVVETLVCKEQNAGVHTLTFKRKNLLQGTYFYYLKINDRLQFKKFIVIN